jgi:hypothetical protein
LPGVLVAVLIDQVRVCALAGLAAAVVAEIRSLAEWRLGRAGAVSRPAPQRSKVSQTMRPGQ